jgi:hypothetical protein
MDASINQQSQPRGFLSRFQIFRGILNWLVGFTQFTAEELESAGIYFGE